MKYGWCVNILYSIPPTQSGTAYTRVSVMQVCYVCTFTARLQPWCTFFHFLCTYLLKPVLFDLTAFSNFSLISTDSLLLFYSNHFKSSALQMSVCVLSCSWHSSVVLLMFQTIWRLASAPSHGAIEEDCRDSHDLIPLNLIAIQSRSKWQGNHPKVFLRVRVGTYKNSTGNSNKHGNYLFCI